MKSMLWINNIYNRKGLLDLPLEFIYEISGYLNKKIRKNSKDKYHKEKNTSRKFYKLHYISIQRNANGVSPRHHFYVLNYKYDIPKEKSLNLQLSFCMCEAEIKVFFFFLINILLLQHDIL